MIGAVTATNTITDGCAIPVWTVRRRPCAALHSQDAPSTAVQGRRHCGARTHVTGCLATGYKGSSTMFIKCGALFSQPLYMLTVSAQVSAKASEQP